MLIFYDIQWHGANNHIGKNDSKMASEALKNKIVYIYIFCVSIGLIVVVFLGDGIIFFLFLR